MNNILGIAYSFLFVLIIIIISSIFIKLKPVNNEVSRKFIHIAFGNWWLIAMHSFTDEDSYLYASIIPIIFIISNYYSYRMNFFKAMERQEEKTLGTVYYPISLLILVIFTFGIIKMPYIGAIGILIMAYGDGLAAIFGKNINSKKIYQNKTLVGSLAMFFSSVIVTTMILLIFNPYNLIINVLIVSLVATIVELYSKRGLDNITVPIISSLAYFLLISM